ncbi:alpha/beta fold hydrolase [Streptomyces actinomycinicus]|uniref:Alpha/beta fold hydrolase n=1 Tax=Streptomyces actinomycinicus TaxID=1695166 RepID=A0A937JNS2_9ACTN|nr:alpha/beta hydrolase [Streptomyces actinomycinicus]MBL1083636.1 alpha/beta fold hydrolase [Streptomyces actinomycinicus]
MRVTSGDGVRIAFEVMGTGPPLVLLHGFFGDRTTWRSAGHVDALAGDHRLVLVDARGHGGSDSPHDVDSYRIDRQVRDVVAVLDALDISRAAFWGASMGGIIGLNLLAEHPERLTALIAGGAHGGHVAAAPAEIQQEVELFRTRGMAPFIEMLELQGPLPAWMREAMQAADPHALAALTAALDDRDGVLERLVRTPVPVLLLAGDRDPRLRSIRDTAARVRGATCVELSGCGHLDTFLRLDLTLPVVRPFLAEYAAG